MAKGVKMSEVLKEVIGYAGDLAALTKEYDKLEWVVYTTGYDFGLDKAYEALSDYLKNEERFVKIKEVKKQDLSVEDARRVELIYHKFEPFHFSEEINRLNEVVQTKANELSQVLNTFRFQLDGVTTTSVELDQILRSHPDREKRKAAYLAKAQINQPLVDAGFLELIELRKQLAKEREFSDFVAMKLYENELPQDMFDDWKQQLKSYLKDYHETRTHFAKQFLDDTMIYPWDVTYVRSQIAPALNATVDMINYYEQVKELFGKFGFDLDAYPITYDIFSRANKSEWGYMFPIEKGKDARILANVKGQYSEYGVLLHETGHCVHHFLKDPDEHALDLGEIGIISEGIANLFGNMIYKPIFYKGFFNDEQVQEHFEQLYQWEKMSRLGALTKIFFDHNLYRTELESEGDIQDLYKETMKSLFGKIDSDEEAAWAYLIHHTTHPIYLHNYFMGDVTVDIIKDAYTQKAGITSVYDNPEGFGKFLKEAVIDVSGQYTFIELLKRLGCGGFRF